MGVKNTMRKDVNSRVADVELYKLFFLSGHFTGVACEMVIDFLGSSNRVVSTNDLACEMVGLLIFYLHFA